jgi:hypothetical protein
MLILSIFKNVEGMNCELRSFWSQSCLFHIGKTWSSKNWNAWKLGALWGPAGESIQPSQTSSRDRWFLPELLYGPLWWFSVQLHLFSHALHSGLVGIFSWPSLRHMVMSWLLGGESRGMCLLLSCVLVVFHEYYTQKRIPENRKVLDPAFANDWPYDPGHTYWSTHLLDGLSSLPSSHLSIHNS